MANNCIKLTDMRKSSNSNNFKLCYRQLAADLLIFVHFALFPSEWSCDCTSCVHFISLWRFSGAAAPVLLPYCSSAGRVFWVSAWGLFWKICRLCRVLSEASHSLHVTYMIKASCEWCWKYPVLNGMVGSIDTVLHRIPAKASLTVGPSIISISHLHPRASYTQGETTVRKHTGLENNIC